MAGAQSSAAAPSDEPPDPSRAWYLTKAQLEATPARQALLQKCSGDVEKAREKEVQYRRLTVGFLQEAGQKLRLPQLSIATAIVFYHRFYSRKSYDSYDRFRIATTCLFLAGKVEETPKKIKDVVVEAYKAQFQKQSGPDPESKEFWDLKENILVCERILLQTLDFDLTVEHAYRPLLAYVKSIKGTRDLAQVAWNFINDSLRTTISLQYPPRCVAAASVSLASRFLGGNGSAQYQLPPHHGKPWNEAFKVSQAEVDDINEQILAMYDGAGCMAHTGRRGGATASLSTSRPRTPDGSARLHPPRARGGSGRSGQRCRARRVRHRARVRSRRSASRLGPIQARGKGPAPAS